VAVVECLDAARLTEESMAESRLWRRSVPGRTNVHFLDMSGPGAVTPYARLRNLCLVVSPPDDMNPEEQLGLVHASGPRLADYLARLVADLTPPEVETFDLAPAPGLPRIVYIPHLASEEPAVGARGTYGTAVYGQIRLSAPWLLEPTELLDGAVSGGGFTWTMANHPIVLDLCRRHGRELDFRGVIVQRTNWTNQGEYRLAADRAGRLAIALGAEGAIITTDLRGQRWVGTMLTLAACEQAGIKTVLLTEEEDNEDGTPPPLLFAPPELAAAVSMGTGDAGPFPAVERVIGTIEEAPGEWQAALPAIRGRYGTAHVRDYEGFGTQSYADF
jgi:glycine reductase